MAYSLIQFVVLRLRTLLFLRSLNRGWTSFTQKISCDLHAYRPAMNAKELPTATEDDKISPDCANTFVYS